jgi:hypothetical protein
MYIVVHIVAICCLFGKTEGKDILDNPISIVMLGPTVIACIFVLYVYYNIKLRLREAKFEKNKIESDVKN